MELIFEYKCRRCGVIVKDTPDRDDGLYLANLLRLGGKSIEAHLVSSHRCDVSNRGVTDLIGCTYTEERPT